MEESQQVPVGGVVATTEFVRHRNALLAQASLTDLYLEHYLHLADRQVQLAPEHDLLLKKLLAIVVLHSASRPRNEIMAWTVNLQDPLCNLFASGDNEDCTVVGRVFTENIKQGPENLFFLETSKDRGPVRRSVVSFQGADLFSAGESFYTNSEQRGARFFDLGDETIAMLSEHPDCDLDWFRSIDTDGVRKIRGNETVVGLERRHYQWKCGCSEQRIFKILLPGLRQNPDELFGGEDFLRLDCPRCGAHFRILREALEAYAAEHDS